MKLSVNAKKQRKKLCYIKMNTVTRTITMFTIDWLIGNWFIYRFHTEFNICGGFFGENCVSQMLANSFGRLIFTHTHNYTNIIHLYCHFLHRCKYIHICIYMAAGAITTMSDVCRVTLEAHWWLKTAPFGSRLEWWALGEAALSPISQESTLGYHSTSPGSTARSPPTSRASSPLCPPRLTSSTSQFLCCSPSSPSSSLSLSSHRNASFLLNITGKTVLSSSVSQTTEKCSLKAQKFTLVSSSLCCFDNVRQNGNPGNVWFYFCLSSH